MNIAKIKPLIKEEKRVSIVRDASGRQWVGTGRNLYLADENIDFDKDNVLSIFDIEAEKRKAYDVSQGDMSHAAWLDMMPHNDTDKPLNTIFSVCYVDELLTLMRTEEGESVLVRQKAITPNDGRGGQTFVLRKTGGNPVVACFADMLCGAIVAPESAKVFEIVSKWCKALTESNYCVKEG